VAGRVCGRCGGPLAPDATVCPWCATPVQAQTKVSYERPAWMIYGFDEEDDLDDQLRTALILGLVLLVIGATLLALYVWTAPSCPGVKSCDGFGPFAVGIGILLTLIGLFALASWAYMRPRRIAF